MLSFSTSGQFTDMSDSRTNDRQSEPGMDGKDCIHHSEQQDWKYASFYFAGSNEILSVQKSILFYENFPPSRHRRRLVSFAAAPALPTETTRDRDWQ